jgi:hypothetical protein
MEDQVNLDPENRIVNVSRLLYDGIGTPPSSISHASPYLISANKISIAKLESVCRQH